MQCFKLINGGFVDKMIVFNELPKRLMNGIKTREVAGFPRSWARWLTEIGSLRPVLKTETEKVGPGDYKYTYTEIGKEPCFFVLDYLDTNADKEAWHAIGEYLRMHVGPEVRLKEKIEDMAMALAPDSKAQLAVEPEDIPVVPVPSEVVAEPGPQELVKPDEKIIVHEAKKRGRPKKAVAVGV